MELEVLFPGLPLPHLSYTEIEVECLKSLQVGNLTATEGIAAFGNAVTDLRTDYCVVLALPKTQMTELIEGRLDITESFTMGH